MKSLTEKKSQKRKGGGGGGEDEVGGVSGIGGGGPSKREGRARNKKKSKSVATAEDYTRFEDVPWVLIDGLGGYFFSFAVDENIHAALAFENLPQGLVRGETAAESSANLKAW
jgi:hypothetical protein